MDIVKELQYVDKKEYINDYCDKHTEMKNKILSIISKKAASIDTIKLNLNLKDKNIEELLFNMELKGEIKQGGGVFSI